MNQAQLLRLEDKAILIDSEYFNDVTYALHKEGKGMWLIAADKIVPIDEPDKFAKEMLEVWENMKPEK